MDTMHNQFWIYMMANAHHNVLYTGVTNDLYRRVGEHKRGLVEGFTKRYNCHHLVYYEEYPDIRDAIAREKQLKNWHRAWKDDLVNRFNPGWKDLAADWYSEEEGDCGCHPDPESSSG